MKKETAAQRKTIYRPNHHNNTLKRVGHNKQQTNKANRWRKDNASSAQTHLQRVNKTIRNVRGSTGTARKEVSRKVAVRAPTKRRWNVGSPLTRQRKVG